MVGMKTHIPPKEEMKHWSPLNALIKEVEAESFVEWCDRTEYRGLIPDMLEYPKVNPFVALRKAVSYITP